MISHLHPSKPESYPGQALKDPIMSRQDRLELLCTLIAQQDYRTQAELIAALAIHHVHLTQSSISRDIKALALIKVHGVYKLPEVSPQPNLPPIDGQVWHHILTLHHVGEHLLVLRVKAATAQLVGAALDALPLPGLAGTIAGDDTIFVALKDQAHQQALSDRLRRASGIT